MLWYFPALHLDGALSLQSSFTRVHFTTCTQLGHGVWAEGGFHAMGRSPLPPPCPSIPHSSSPHHIYLVLIATSQTPFSSPNPLSAPPSASQTVYSSLDFVPPALAPYFPCCRGCQHPGDTTQVFRSRSWEPLV